MTKLKKVIGFLKTVRSIENIKKEQNCTLIVVTHDPRILGFADRILEIEDGAIRTDPSEFVREQLRLKPGAGPIGV